MRLANGRVFCHIDNGIPDGIRTDVSGNLWSRAADGIHCVDTTGN
ncbi:sugar lactone lactonase YvrE [Rhizobium sp. BK008]|nr:sugar lactone lactonase YvrE [Rhizobium sp. BK008]